jgi:hypothetical protein
MQAVKTITNREGTRKVEIFRRPNGTFGFEELKWWDAPENSWTPTGRYSIAVIDTFDRAIEEAKGRVSWLASRV